MNIKIVIIFILAVMIPLIFAFYFSFDSINQDVMPKIEENYLKGSSNTMLSIDIVLYNQYLGIQKISNNPILKDERSSPEQIRSELLKLKEEYKSFVSLSFFDPEGIGIADTEDAGIGERHDLSVFWHDLADKNVSFYYSPEPQTVFAASLVKNEGGLSIGMLRAESGLKEIKDILTGAEGYLILFDKDRNIISSNDPYYELTEKIEDMLSVKEVLAGKTGILYELNLHYNQEVLTAYVSEKGYKDFEGNEWGIIHSVRRDVVFSPLVALGNRFLLFGSIIAVIVIALSFFLSKQIVKPIAELKRVTKEVMAGKEVSVPAGMKGEIGELAISFSSMIENLNESRKRIEEYSKTVEQKVGVRTKDVEKSRLAMAGAMDDLNKTNKQLFQAKTRLRTSYKKLKELDVKKDQFISMAAHELKTPLNSIHGFSELLLNESTIKDKEKRNKYLNIIGTESTRLVNLVTEILDLSRVDVGTIKYDFKKLNMTEIIEDIKKMLAMQIKEKGLSAEYIIEKLPAAMGDKEKTIQVIMNLMTNAIKYTPKGKIKVKAYKDDGNVHVEISDTGIGIAKKELEKIFERFYQIESEITRKTHGTGLGLSLCKEFIKAMDGKIWAESEPGKGSTFHFTLPIKE